MKVTAIAEAVVGLTTRDYPMATILVQVVAVLISCILSTLHFVKFKRVHSNHKISERRMTVQNKKCAQILKVN